MATLDDIAHFWGGDLAASVAGDPLRANTAIRSQQRVLRRLMTVPGEYLSHPTYGAGLPGLVGTNASPNYVVALIRGQMLLEESVSKSIAPTISVISIFNGLQVAISYVALPDRQPVALKFTVQP
jgi:hypothetical protein